MLSSFLRLTRSGQEATLKAKGNPWDKSQFWTKSSTSMGSKQVNWHSFGILLMDINIELERLVDGVVIMQASHEP